jgi:peroxiredoxin
MANMGGDLLEQAENFLKSGNKQAALPILMEYVKQNPNSARGWWVLSFAVSDPARQVECLERVLRLAPQNGKARERLEKLKGGGASRPKVFSFKGNNGVLIASLLGVFLCGAVGTVFLFMKLINPSQQTNSTQPMPAPALLPTQSLPATWTPTPAPTETPAVAEYIVPMETPLFSADTDPLDATNLELQRDRGLSEGNMAPDFTLENVATGKREKLSDYLGHPVILFFLVGDGGFVYCDYEAVALQRVYEENKKHGLVVLGINMGGYYIGESGGVKQGVAYRNALGLTYPILNDWQTKVFKLYEGDVYPANYFIDENGVISNYYSGAMDYSMININLRTMLGLIPTAIP